MEYWRRFWMNEDRLLSKLRESWGIRDPKRTSEGYILDGGHPPSRYEVSREEAIEIAQSRASGDYIVTKDLPIVLQERYDLDLAEDQKREIELEEDRMTSLWESYVPGVFNYEKVDARDLREAVDTRIRNSEIPVVSLSNVYGPSADFALDATRITDPETGTSQLGSRDPEISLSDQLDEISRELSRVNLADSGIFTGETLKEVAKRLESRGVEVDGAYLGIAPLDYQERLNFRASAVNEANIGLSDGEVLGEWIEGRDLATGIEGRKTIEGGVIPYSQNPDWLSIPEEKAERARQEMEDYGDRILEILDLENPEGVFGKNVEFRA
jgi:hypothetical protein